MSKLDFDALAAPTKPYTERDIIELMVRAPAVPEWFEPDIGPAPRDPRTVQGCSCDGVEALYRLVDLWEEKMKSYKELLKKQRLAQWPRAYAKMVLEAK